MNVKDRNDKVREVMVLPDTCLYTKRELVGEHSAEARCQMTDDLRALVSWHHRFNGTVVQWLIPLGSKVVKRIPEEATDEEIAHIIREGFEAMDSHCKSGVESKFNSSE